MMQSTLPILLTILSVCSRGISAGGGWSSFSLFQPPIRITSCKKTRSSSSTIMILGPSEKQGSPSSLLSSQSALESKVLRNLKTVPVKEDGALLARWNELKGLSEKAFSDKPFNSFHRASKAPSSFTGTVFRFLSTFDSNADWLDSKLDGLPCFSEGPSIIMVEDDDLVFLQLVMRIGGWKSEKDDHPPPADIPLLHTDKIVNKIGSVDCIIAVQCAISRNESGCYVPCNEYSQSACDRRLDSLSSRWDVSLCGDGIDSESGFCNEKCGVK